jgi:ATP-binding cassette subfamily F protein uup
MANLLALGMTAPVLTARDLHKAYGPQVVLDGVSLSFHEGERVGLVGVNGSGKSTLARLLAGAEPADSGDVATRRDATVMYLSQEPVFDAEKPARDVAREGLARWADARARHDALSRRIAAEGDGAMALIDAQTEAAAEVERLSGWEMDHRVDAILTRLGLERAEAPVGELSGGERRRVALARVLVARPALAILDEPTNHLDVQTIEWLERYLLSEHPGALLLITHDRYLIDRVAQRTVELDRGQVASYDGGWEDYLEAKAARLALEERTEANRQSFLRRELEWLRRSPKARTTKQKARIDRAQAAVATAPQVRRDAVDRLEMRSARLGRTVLETRGLGITVGDRRLVDGLDLVVGKGERIGIVGRNGAGKTTLLRTLLGERAPESGAVVVGKNTRFAYLDQTRAGLSEDGSILDNVAGDQRRFDIGGGEIDVRSWLEGFGFDGAKQRQKVSALSGGERARVTLAKMLLEPANVIVLDEPTNDLDVTTLGALEEMLVELDGTALVVTHDRYFLDRVATHILAFEEAGRVVRYAGNYQAFRAMRDDAQRESPPAQAKRAPPRPKPIRTGLTYGERLELEGLMERIDSAEKAVAEREAALADPELYATRGGEVPRLTESLATARAALEQLLARWEELEAKKLGDEP